MASFKNMGALAMVGTLLLGLGACSDDPEAPPPENNNQTQMTLCEKYGGPDTVATVVSDFVLAEIAGDCRISSHFTSLDEDGLTHVAECLTVQVQELFGCDGITYAGHMSSVDRECRDMVAAHAGLGISQADFDALIEDTVAGLTKAGVEEADINAAAPALLGMSDDIVEDDSDMTTMGTCE